jgi:hypothetical protein
MRLTYAAVFLNSLCELRCNFIRSRALVSYSLLIVLLTCSCEHGHERLASILIIYILLNYYRMFRAQSDWTLTHTNHKGRK